MSLKRALTAAVTTAVIATGFAAPATAAPLGAIGLLLGTNTAAEVPCTDLGVLLRNTNMINDTTTARELTGNLTAAGDRLAEPLGLRGTANLITAKTAGDITDRARECGLVRPDPIDDALAAIGSSELSRQLPVLSSAIKLAD
ncbi:hypothetical protein OS125_03820 [Corynebacterium sp. P7003]|uniref:Secreted protein n=1 Tax=Corynebacterium pygosceleis TaxID=2800406 RepID=A0ABT3WQN2_9CORY|nr:hypothetical protein [Corynebacterium pygosceleis]MCX7444373.1 hypothetical protein [Corynebacterium pygosceleis]